MVQSNPNLSREQRLAANESLLYNGVPLDSLCLTFVLPGDDEYELIPNGKDVEVSFANLQLFIDSVCHGYLLDSVREQAESFINGFSQFIGVENMQTFKSFEIEQVFCGTDGEEWNDKYLRENVMAQHGYGSNSDCFNNLIKVMSLFTKEEKKDFLMFTIGKFFWQTNTNRSNRRAKAPNWRASKPQPEANSREKDSR